MKPEKQKLIHDLLGGHGCREATLQAGGRILRRRRYWRVAAKGMVMVSMLAAVLVWHEWTNPRRTSGHPPTAKLPASPQLEALTDDQLLALFPNTPVGLATLSDGRKRLIFPRPGDAQKYITRL